MLQPVTQVLQTVQLDVLRVHDHVQQMLVIFETHRREADVRFKEYIMGQADKIAKAVGIELRIPRQSKTVEEYYRVAVFIPDLDYIIKSRRTWFAPDNKNHFALFSLHPALTSQLDRNSFRDRPVQARV